MIDPQARALLRMIEAKGFAPMTSQTPTEARATYLERRWATQAEPTAVAKTHDHTVTANGVGFTVREYQPLARAADVAGGLAHSAPVPALVYLHGGGWVIGDLDTHDVLCRSLCNESGMVVVSVDYRLAPEHVFPAAFDDAVAAFTWVAENAEALGVDTQRIAIGGDSAGGNLAAAAALALRGQAVSPRFQLLIYPATDMRRVAPSHTTNGEGYLLTREVMNWFGNHYVPRREDDTDWRASPLLAASLSGVPPAFVLTAGFDPLRDEGLQYADALSAAGVATEYVCFERQIHGFITMGRALREANTAVTLCASVLKKALG
jgi:acetyl esterase